MFGDKVSEGCFGLRREFEEESAVGFSGGRDFEQFGEGRRGDLNISKSFGVN